MERITLTRTGQAPLVFDGERIADGDTQGIAGREHTRGHVAAVYRTAAGTYVVAVAFQTKWQGEQDRQWAVPASAGREVETLLREIGAESQALPVGYPAGEAYAEKQARMLVDLAARYDHLVSEILGAHPDFAERLE